MMDCNKIQNLLAQKNISDSQECELMKHIENCSECNEYIQNDAFISSQKEILLEKIEKLPHSIVEDYFLENHSLKINQNISDIFLMKTLQLSIAVFVIILGITINTIYSDNNYGKLLYPSLYEMNSVNILHENK